MVLPIYICSPKLKLIETFVVTTIVQPKTFMTYINYLPSPLFPHPTLNLQFKNLRTQFFCQINNMSNPDSYKFLKKNEGPKPIQTKFSGQFWFPVQFYPEVSSQFWFWGWLQLWFRKFLLKIYNQRSRYLLTGPKNGIDPKPEPDNTGKHTYSLVSLRK